jgi:hypothetical protein
MFVILEHYTHPDVMDRAIWLSSSLDGVEAGEAKQPIPLGSTDSANDSIVFL